MRTARVMTTVNGTNMTVPGNATRFSGIAIQQKGSQILQFELKDLDDGRCILSEPILESVFSETLHLYEKAFLQHLTHLEFEICV